MIEINYKPIFDYIDKSSQELEERLKQDLVSKTDLKHLQDTVDGIATNFKNNDEKVAITEEKTERIEHWVISAAKRIDVPYKV